MFLEEARDTLRHEASDRRRAQVSQRASQLTPAGLICLLYAISLLVFYRHGFVAGSTLAVASAMASGMVALFWAAFRCRWNLRAADPTLMLPQLLGSLLLMLGVAAVERATQMALVPFALIAFSFGIFRLNTASLTLLASGYLGAYLAIILIRGHVENFAMPAFRTDLVQWCVLALTLPGMILLGKQIQSLRTMLRTTRSELQLYEEKAAHDELTGMYNRRQLQLELERARQHAERHGATFSLCLIDIDHFKQINDCNGHLVGDKILREFSRLARESVRDSDIIGRYGGDEFMQILPDTEIKGAVMHAERLRVYAHFLDLEKVLAQKKISLSIGVAQYRPGERIEELIARADAALYQAKQFGRNRVEWLD